MNQLTTRDIRFLIRKYFMMSTDMLLLIFSLLIYFEVAYPAMTAEETLRDKPGWYFLILIIWLIYASVFGLYSLANVPRTNVLVGRTLIVTILTGLTYLLIPFVSPVFPKHRFPVFVFMGEIVIFITLWHFLFSTFFKHPILAKRAIVVGAGWAGKEIVKTLYKDPYIYHHYPYHIYGFIDDDKEKWGKEYEGVKVLSGGGEDLFKYARRLKVDEVIMAMPTVKQISPSIFHNLTNCSNYGIDVIPVGQLYEQATGKVIVKKIGEEYYLTYAYGFRSKNNLYLFVTRIINIVCGLIGMAAFLIATPFVCLANLMFSRGPLLYSQVRVGLHNKEFRIYKFRTMVVGAEKGTGAVWAQKGDARITPLGRILRKSRIDELPQAWNVLKGEMNLLGPRPERPEIVEKLLKVIPFYNTRHLVKPGITGWAQVNYKYGASVEDTMHKLQFDLYYIKYRSLWLDFWILLKTIGVVAKFKGT